MAEVDTEEKKMDEPEDTNVSAVKETGSPPPNKAMPPKPRDLQAPPARSPSVTSTHSTASGSAPRSTTTSRRGGRTRSRSPPTMVNRVGGSINPSSERDFPEGNYSTNQSQPSPANPSSAAAAAAAAAKALSSGNAARNGNQWFDGEQGGRRTEGPRYHSGYDNMYSGGSSRNWPGEGDVDRRQRPSRPREGEADGRNYSSRSQYPGPKGDAFHPAGGGQRYDQQYREYDAGWNERASPGGDRSRYPPRREETDEYFRNDSNKPNAFRPDAYSPKASNSRDVAPSTVKRSGGSTGGASGGTSRVIGTATPIHVPRAADPPGSASRHHASGGTPSSVFRRSGDDLPAPPNDQRNDSQQKLLMSLRTPTASFEENQTKRKSSKDGAPPLSPEEPPQIQHAHQSQMDQALFFDQPSRGSPKGSSSGQATIEMAPSFSLFNQSFDSLGDTANYLNVQGPLDAAFTSTSFGAGPTTSTDNIDSKASAQLLPSTSATGSFAVGERNASFLGSSSGIGFTFGMSPVNSFGNQPPPTSATSRRSGNMMVLGGPDHQPTSPTQMLSMYPSYSGGYGSQGSGHGPGQNHFRSRNDPALDQSQQMRLMNSGSFNVGPGGYTRSFEASPHGQNYHMGGNEGPRPHDGPPMFYKFLGRNRAAFVECTFLLPGLKAALLESPLSDSKKPGEEDKIRKMTLGGRRGRYNDPTPQDNEVALRRVTSAICAFGGSIIGDRVPGSSKESKESNQASIFREKDEGGPGPTATVTPSSSTSTPPGNRDGQTKSKKYDEMLPSRYYENENRLSWEFEETPPVGNDDEEGAFNDSAAGEDSTEAKVKAEGASDDGTQRPISPPTPDGEEKFCQPADGEEGKEDDSSQQADQPKMRYRCKLCGQPKQNHTCPYQQSLQRSIGIMVYPAVNAFTASEPGLLAPALSDMNNFVSHGGGDSSADSSPSRPTPDRSRRGHPTISTPGSTAANVTPETMRSSNSSTSSVGQRTPLRSPGSAKRKPRGSNLSGGAAMGQRVGTGSPPGSASRKRSHAQMLNGGDEDLLFVETGELKPEQFRIVTPSKKPPSADAYTYPSLPLPYAQRKRLSDNLFALSKEVPQLTDECAVVLREAREKDMWDIAVAELMTQVVVVIHCHENDVRFEGLRHYLLTLGIAC